MDERIREIKLDNELLYLKKGFDGWRIVYPLKNMDGSWNWNNVIFGGNYWKLVKIVFVFVLLIIATMIYNYDTKTCSETLTHINEVCAQLRANYSSVINYSGMFNEEITKLNNPTNET